MIFVTIGTWHRGFDRLLKGVHDLLKNGTIKEPVLAQTGHSSFKSDLVESTPFLVNNEFVEKVKEARLIIAHAGVGSIFHALDLAKPIVVVPRKAAEGEADNDHQFATARQLESEGKILVAYEIDQLAAKIEEARSWSPSHAQTNPLILAEVRRFLEDVAVQKRKRNKTEV